MAERNQRRPADDAAEPQSIESIETNLGSFDFDEPRST